MSDRREFDLAATSVRELNRYLHAELPGSDVTRISVQNPNGQHSIGAGLDCPVEVDTVSYTHLPLPTTPYV